MSCLKQIFLMETGMHITTPTDKLNAMRHGGECLTPGLRTEELQGFLDHDVQRSGHRRSLDAPPGASADPR